MMDENPELSYNGNSRHFPGDEREGLMEMTKLMGNTGHRDKPLIGPGIKFSASAEALSLSLHQFARNGDEHNLKILLRSHSAQVKKKINQHDEDHFTPLHYAARYNRLSVVKLLVEAGADVQALGADDVTPLHHAARFRRGKKKIKETFTSVSDEDVCAPPPPPPEIDISEEDPESERMIEAYRAWENRLSVSLDQIEENELIRQMGATSLPVLFNHTEHEKGGSVVSYLISKGANINAVDIYGQTPLHFAAMRGNEMACKDLLSFKSRVKIDASDNQGITPLHTAAIHRQMEVAHMLIEAGANLMCRDKESSTPMHHAAMEGSLELVKMLFEVCTKTRESWITCEMVNTTNVESNTPLHVAVENGHYEVAKFLLEKQSDVNKPCKHFMYPLHLAAQAGDIRIVNLLVENHAQIDAINDDLATALHRASAFNHIEVVKFLIESGACINQKDKDNCTPLLLAAIYGNVEMLELLLQKGADYTAVDRHDKTAIYLAAEKNHLNVLLKLLSYPQLKKLKNESDFNENDPLHVASREGYLEIVQCLLKHGAVLDSKNEDEQTPLHLASKFGRTNVVRELIKHNTTIVNDEDENSNTALHLAAQYGHDKVASVLLDLGANVFARNYSMWTPLDLAASKGWTHTCLVLLENDAPVDPIDRNKTTPLHLAAAYGHAGVVELLLEWKANVTLQDDQGRNCLDRAIDGCHVSVAMVIINSSVWKDALRNVTQDPVTGYIVTPMRKLIKKMPEVAQRVFDRCMSFGQEQNPEKPDYEITFDYEFLDDVYASWIQIGSKQNDDDRCNFAATAGSTHGDHDDNELPLSTEPYSRDSDVLKKNNPLFIMILSERKNLLSHPLVTSLLQHKWNTFGRFFYYLSFFIYVIFLTFLTAYMVTTDPPHLYGSDAALIEDNQCANLTKQYEQPLCASIGTYVIIALAGFNLLKELFQIYQAKLNYFGWTNILEWTVYVTALLLVISFNECQRMTGYRLMWQWNLGAVAVFLVWFDLLLFIQKVPRFGIYVVMFTDILWTFSQFFVVFFLFIVAFALAFYAAFQNQVAFASVPKSLIKTYVMMIGELEFEYVFNDPVTSSVFYPEASYILYLFFLTSMSILIMNLLVGLAVDDIKAVQEQAALKRMAMQVDLALDVERIIPDFIRQKAYCQKKTICPNKSYQNPFMRILTDSYLSPKTLQNALNPRLNEIEQLKESQDKLTTDVKRVKRSIEGIKQQNQRLESMLKAIVTSQNIHWQEEDYQEDSEVEMQEEQDGVL